MQAQTLDRSYAAKLLVGLLVLGALTTALMFRPRQPSAFTEHGAFGAGHGSESLMIGARPRKGAAR
jgi:hypothetical protein